MKEMSIRNQVYEQRVLRRLSQQQLAEAVGVSKQTILAIEKGNYSPTLKLAFRLASYFNIPLEQLFRYEEGENDDRTI
jgi:putative transcriptional regulator